MSAEYTHSLEHKPGQRFDVDAILSRRLSAETIDTYADDALNDLVELVQRATDAYKREPTVHFENGQDQETAAFGYYQLGDVERLLDHIADKSEELRHLDDVIAHVPVIDRVITPPDSGRSVHIQEGDGSYAEKKQQPRLKTLLFILGNEFGIDVNDSDQIRIEKGILPDDVMRRASYHMVDIPSLQRRVLVCDEVENATYIFNDNVLRQHDIDGDALLDLTKTDLNNLLEQDPLAGQRLVYSDAFVSDLIDTITDPSTSPHSPSEAVSSAEGKYLYPEAPQDYLTMTGMAEARGISRDLIRAAIAAVSDNLGYVGKYKYGRNIAFGYSPDQQQLIYDACESQGTTAEQAPEGYLSASALGEALGNRKAVFDAVADLGSALGEVNLYKFGNQVVPGYSDEQQQIIMHWLDVRGYFSEKAPEGYLTKEGISKVSGASTDVIEKVIEELGDELGEVSLYKFEHNIALGYSPHQQGLIRQRLAEKSLIGHDAPEGYLTMRGVAGEIGVNARSVKIAIEKLGDELGEVDVYKFDSHVVPGYSPDQQNRIREYLTERGVFAELAPEGYLSNVGIAKALGMRQAAIDEAIGKVRGRLGDTKVWKFNAKSTVEGFSPDQQDIIRQRLEADGKFAPPPPEGYLSAYGIARQQGRKLSTIQQAIDVLGPSLGEVRSYKYQTKVAPGYSPHQAEMIKNYSPNKKRVA